MEDDVNVNHGFSRISLVLLMIFVVDGLVLLSHFINGYNGSVAVLNLTMGKNSPVGLVMK